jgi:molybdopterin converting factor small subunit
VRSGGGGFVKVTVVLPGVLREDAGGLGEVVVEPAGSRDGRAQVAGVLDVLGERLPKVERRIRDETGQLRRHVNLFVGETDVRTAGGEAAPVRDGDVILVLPSVAGG